MNHLYYKPVILGMEHGITFSLDKDSTVQEWLELPYISTFQCLEYENARKAWEIKNSKLAGLLK